VIGQSFDTMIVALSDKDWVMGSWSWKVLETVMSHLKNVRANFFCASLLRTQIHATSCMSARAPSNKMNK